MRIYNCNNFNFKGYDALPLKRIYAEKNAGAKFEKEMQEVAQKEGFEFCLVEDDDWPENENLCTRFYPVQY